MTPTPKTIQIFLPGGDPRGIRIAEITTRILQVIEVPRSLLPTFLKMPQSGQVALGMDALIASILAFGAALLAMTLMMRWLQQMTFMPFVVYRLLLGGGLLYWIYV